MQDSQMFSLRDFQAWLSNYNQNKANQQDFGVKNIPARIFRKTIDLSTAGVLQNTGIPFDGLQVEKVYVTATGVSADGSINIIFDRAMSDSQFNFKTLKENDSFTSGTSISRAFFSWAAQAGMSVDIVFFNDIDYKSGSQKTTLVGAVTTVPTNTVATAIKPATPVSNSRISQLGAGTSATYTVAVGKVAKVTFFASLNATASGLTFRVDGSAIITSAPLNGQFYTSFTLNLAAGQTADIVVTGAGAEGRIYAEEYAV